MPDSSKGKCRAGGGEKAIYWAQWGQLAQWPRLMDGTVVTMYGTVAAFNGMAQW